VTATCVPAYTWRRGLRGDLHKRCVQIPALPMASGLWTDILWNTQHSGDVRCVTDAVFVAQQGTQVPDWQYPHASVGGAVGWRGLGKCVYGCATVWLYGSLAGPDTCFGNTVR
jgi:hypothetical protein